MSTWPYDGDWGGLRVDELPEVFVALANAVNERQRALAIDSTPIYTAWWLNQDGTSTTTFPTVDDFVEFQIIGASDPISPGLLHNLVSLNMAVHGFTNYYVDAVGSEVPVDYSEVTTKWGAFTIDPPKSWRDHRLWCRCRDALTLMRYRQWSLRGEAINDHEIKVMAAPDDTFTFPAPYEPPEDPWQAQFELERRIWRQSETAITWFRNVGGNSVPGWWQYKNFHNTYEFPAASIEVANGAGYPYYTWERDGCSVTFPFSEITNENGEVVKVKGEINTSSYLTKYNFVGIESYGGDDVTASAAPVTPGLSSVYEREFPTWKGGEDHTWGITKKSFQPEENPADWLVNYPFSFTTSTVLVGDEAVRSLHGGHGKASIEINNRMRVWIDQQPVITDLQ